MVTVVEMPTNRGFTTLLFGLRPNSTVFVSPTNTFTQSMENPGDKWEGVWEVQRMTLAEAAAWKAFLANLQGSVGRFHAFDPSVTTPFGTYASGSDTPLVNGASETGKSLATKGWRNNGGGLLLPGDTFELTITSIKRLFMVTANVDSNGSGDATIAIIPPLPDSPADSLALVLDTPKVEMMLVDNSQAFWNVPTNKLIGGFAFAATEAP